MNEYRFLIIIYSLEILVLFCSNKNNNLNTFTPLIIIIIIIILKTKMGQNCENEIQNFREENM